MKRLLILSGKGGTGKTTVAASLINLSKATAFADCDVDAPNLHLVQSFDVEPETKDFTGADKAYINEDKCINCGLCKEKCRFDAIFSENGKMKISEYACEGCGVCEYVCPQKAVTLKPDIAGSLSLYKDKKIFSTAELKMGRGNSGKLVTEVKSNLFNAAKDEPFAILDGSPGTGCPVMASISGSDVVLIVTEPTVSGQSDLERIVKTISLSGSKPAVCINRYDINEEKSNEIENWCRTNSVAFVGTIPFDPKASEAINQGKSVVEIDCPAATSIKKIYSNVLNLLGGI